MKFKQVLLIFLSILSLGSVLYLYRDFLINILIAGLICIATFGIKQRLDHIFTSRFLNSILSVFVLTLFFIIPLFFVVQQGVKFFSQFQTSQIMYYVDSSKEGLRELLASFPVAEKVFANLTQDITSQNIANWGLKLSSHIGKESLSLVVDLGFIILFLFVFFYYGRSVYIYILKLSPLNIRETHRIFEEVVGVLKIVLFTSIVNVILQGLFFGIFIYFFDFKYALILGILYGIAALVPVVGGALVWIPIVGYELFLGNTWQAIGIAIYAVVFIGFVIDNLLKPLIIGFANHRILSKPLDINEIVIFFAIFAGFSTFGFWGIIIGPAITAFFIAFVRLQRRLY
ncbi:AI-2E family transporter [Helicobacter sp. faydin-H20]|uniref:AI-2E family transporter n=1 Tax=Helicobacter anatolicus TaxID=2905874 RepID=UPI001E52E2B4|nr:AI-2E family transporter [Helicobacter anatolicus]